MLLSTSKILHPISKLYNRWPHQSNGVVSKYSIYSLNTCIDHHSFNFRYLIVCIGGGCSDAKKETKWNLAILLLVICICLLSLSMNNFKSYEKKFNKFTIKLHYSSIILTLDFNVDVCSFDFHSFSFPVVLTLQKYSIIATSSTITAAIVIGNTLPRLQLSQ